MSVPHKYNCPFLLTRPLRDVTAIDENLEGMEDISTHTPLAGRDTDGTLVYSKLMISTHTPLAGRDDGEE